MVRDHCFVTLCVLVFQAQMLCFYARLRGLIGGVSAVSEPPQGRRFDIAIRDIYDRNQGYCKLKPIKRYSQAAGYCY